MENLEIKGTKTTPEIFFNSSSGKLSISGESYPENATEFFKPIFQWLDEYFKNPHAETVFNFKMLYFNTSSSKAILDILDVLDEQYEKGIKISLNWYYETDDEDIQETGEEFTEGLSLPYKLISY